MPSPLRLPLPLATFLVCAVGMGAASAASDLPERVAITDPDLHEISGIVAAHSHDGYWVHNDSGDLPRLYAIDRSGRRLATVRIAGATSFDWEDLAAFELDGRRYLMVGDIGDNLALLHERALFVIAEPAVDPEGDPLAQPAAPLAWQIRFRYEDGPRDAEGLAVDPVDGSVLLLSKRSRPPVLYRLPLHPEPGEAVQVARRLGPLPIPAVPEALSARSGRPRAETTIPTALDLSADRRRLLVTTYLQALVYDRGTEESWSQALLRPARQVGIPLLRQTEAACFDRDQDHAVITSEQSPAPLLRVALPP